MAETTRPTNRQRKEALGAALRAVLTTGRMMSNLCFNIAQMQPGTPLTEHDIAMANEMQVKWDRETKAWRDLNR